MNLVVVTSDPAVVKKFADATTSGPDKSFYVEETIERAHGVLTNTSTLAIQLDAPKSVDLCYVEKLLMDFKGCKVVLMIPADNHRLARQAIRLGVTATVPRDITESALANVLNLVDQGYQIRINPVGESAPISMAAQGVLSPRELQILSLLCDGQPNKQIAGSFGIQEVTVKMHMRSIIRKLGANNRTHAAMVAVRDGLI